MSDEATPRPWATSGRFVYADGRAVSDCFKNTPEAEANARLIVRAVNAHEALVTALRDLLAGIPEFPHPETPEHAAIRGDSIHITVAQARTARAALKLAEDGQ